ncbi:MAG: hypothetical protein MUC33_17255 [Desulfobacterales bacterium]|nr:hypothetical protein [Desulfobacterales bacterium]
MLTRSKTIQIGREFSNPVRENDFVYAGVFSTRYVAPGMDVGRQGVEKQHVCIFCQERFQLLGRAFLKAGLFSIPHDPFQTRRFAWRWWIWRRWGYSFLIPLFANAYPSEN